MSDVDLEARVATNAVVEYLVHCLHCVACAEFLGQLVAIAGCED